MILICYDGSADAQAAIDRAGLLMAGSEATVLVIWETILETMTRHGSLGMGMGMIGAYGDDGADAAIKKAALDTAGDGVQRAAAAGLVAQPRIVNRDDDIAAVILAEAADLDADVIVVGTEARERGVADAGQRLSRGPSSLRPCRPGRSSPSLAEQRHDWAEHAQITASIT